MHGFVRLVFAAALLRRCAESLEDSGSEVIQALAGQTVTLPCSTAEMENLPTVEWSKGDKECISFVYRSGCELHEVKHRSFRYRTHLFMSELQNGNISLRISNVQLSDAGTHTCRTIQNKQLTTTTMELFVGAVSEPKLSVVPSADGGVTLQCEANCWNPEPEITFEDEKGNSITTGRSVTYRDSRGCFNVTRNLTVHTEINRIICKVHQRRINETKRAEIFVPAVCFRSCTAHLTAAGVGAVLIVLLVFTLIHVKWGICVGFQTSGKNTAGGNAVENRQMSQPENNENATNEQIAELEKNLREKEEIICQQAEELKNLKSKQSPDQNQKGQPMNINSPSKLASDVSQPANPAPLTFPKDGSAKPVASPKSKHPKSSSLPRVSAQNPASGPQMQGSPQHPSSPSDVTPNVSSVGRSGSFHGSRPPPGPAHPQRRLSMSGRSTNRYSVLANLSEDEES